MAPTASPSDSAGALARKGTPKSTPIGPHPSYIEVAKPYILQSSIQKCLIQLAMSDAKEDAARLQGVAYIDQVRRALQLPVRTFNTAVVYYHKFRLLHADGEYGWADAAAAALFVSCKIEDTLKKSREILAGWWNLKVSPGEQASSDDPRFENHSKLILGLERLMLESAGFDFRSRHPQKLVVKLARAMGWDKHNASKTAWTLCIDLYRTFAPLKQTTPTMAIACLELAARLHGMDTAGVVDNRKCRYKKWNTSRAEIMETLLDLLDLFNNYRGSTTVGPAYSLETFINIRITLNQEASAANIPRYATYASESAIVSPNSPANHTNGNAKMRNGIDQTSTPRTPATPAGYTSPGTAAVPPASAIGVRGQSGTVRFMLSAQRAREEGEVVDKYWKDEEEEYEEEVVIAESTIGLDRGRDGAGVRERDGPQDWEKERRRDSSIAGNSPTVAQAPIAAERDEADAPAKKKRKKRGRPGAKRSISPRRDRTPIPEGRQIARTDHREQTGNTQRNWVGHDGWAHDEYPPPRRDYHDDYRGAMQDTHQFDTTTPRHEFYTPPPMSSNPNRAPLPSQEELRPSPYRHIDRRDDRTATTMSQRTREWKDSYVPPRDSYHLPPPPGFPTPSGYKDRRWEPETHREFRDTRNSSFLRSPIHSQDPGPARGWDRDHDDRRYRAHSKEFGSRRPEPDPLPLHHNPHALPPKPEFIPRARKEETRPTKTRGRARVTLDEHDHRRRESPQDKNKGSRKHPRETYSHAPHHVPAQEEGDKKHRRDSYYQNPRGESPLGKDSREHPPESYYEGPRREPPQEKGSRKRQREFYPHAPCHESPLDKGSRKPRRESHYEAPHHEPSQEKASKKRRGESHSQARHESPREKGGRKQQREPHSQASRHGSPPDKGNKNRRWGSYFPTPRHESRTHDNQPKHERPSPREEETPPSTAVRVRGRGERIYKP